MSALYQFSCWIKTFIYIYCFDVIKQVSKGWLILVYGGWWYVVQGFGKCECECECKWLREGSIIRINLLPSKWFSFPSIRLGGETVEDYIIFAVHYIWSIIIWMCDGEKKGKRKRKRERASSHCDLHSLLPNYSNDVPSY